MPSPKRVCAIKGAVALSYVSLGRFHHEKRKQNRALAASFFGGFGVVLVLWSDFLKKTLPNSKTIAVIC